jgi:thimet oligopeptidase
MAEQYGFDSQAVRALLRVRAGQAGRARHHRAHVRHPLSQDRRRAGVAPRGRGLRRARERQREAARPHLPRHAPARGQVQARGAVHAGQRQRARRQLPEGVLMCNFPQPTAAEPALMEHDDVRTFFHEFGHLLHHVFSAATPAGPGTVRGATSGTSSRRRRSCSRSGRSTTGDAAAFARHYQTGEPSCRPSWWRAHWSRADELRQGPVRAPADVLRVAQPASSYRSRSARPRHHALLAAEAAEVATRRSSHVDGTYYARCRSATSTATRRSTTRTCGRWSSPRICSRVFRAEGLLDAGGVRCATGARCWSPAAAKPAAEHGARTSSAAPTDFTRLRASGSTRRRARRTSRVTRADRTGLRSRR